MQYQLGIDTGGTYTDAVIVDAAHAVVAKTKQLTTPFDLSIGIGNALTALPAAARCAVNLVALSTTLSTNSVVEGRGAPVAALLPGYTEKQARKLTKILANRQIILLAGGHSATGEELQPLDLATARQQITEQAGLVSAFAISSLFGTRNPQHELALRDLVGELTDTPVACGHELAHQLGAPRRAVTAVLNARMIPYIHTLIDAVETILQQLDIAAPLMIVKGDGSLVKAELARRQPVATVLSGPAASVIGACALSGAQHALVVDMGGTTTDIAVVTNGQPELSANGARIGDWQPMVETLRVFSIGLGGDSEVHFKTKLAISNRRVVPLSLLAHRFPAVLPALERQLAASPSPRNNRFALPLQQNKVLIEQLNAVEMAAWTQLQAGPIELEALAARDRGRLRALAKLERLGLAIYSGFTPSDATHVLGMSTHWESAAAVLGAKIWARQMRHLYGYGNWAEGDAVAPCEQVFDLVVQKISQQLIAAGLHQHDKLDDPHAPAVAELLADLLLLSAKQPPPHALFTVQFAQKYPLVAVGAPAADYFPAVAKRLKLELILPAHADIANALGAVLGAVVQFCHVTVTQPEFGAFYLFHRGQPMHFDALDTAIETATRLATEQAHAAAIAAGAMDIETKINQDANHVHHDIDGELFVSTTITAIATGRPDCMHHVAAKSPA